MIIDVHTHPPPPPICRPAGQAITNAAWRPDKAASISATPADYAQAMEVVDRAITFNIASHPDKDPNAPFDPSDLVMPTKEANDLTAALVQSQRGKVIGFVTVHPYEADPLQEIERGVHELGMRGVKLGLNYQRADLLGSEAYAIYGRAQQLGLPILFHMGTSPVRTAPLIDAYPLHVDRIAIAFPELKIIIAHIGHPWQVDTIVVIRKHPNVYADISAQFFRPWSMYNALRLATEWGVMPKLLFGSDYPIATPAETMAGTRQVNDILEGTKLPRVPEEEIEAIIHRDSLALLGLAD